MRHDVLCAKYGFDSDPGQDKWGYEPPVRPCDCSRFAEVRRDALDAAREAVNRLASDMANWSSAETAAATDATPDLSVDQWMWAQRGVHRAIAAIDALRGEP